MLFLHADERWNNLRVYLMDEENLGKRATTFLFGSIIYMVCPFLIRIQNILMGMCLFEGSTKNFANALRHVVQSLSVQLVVLYDLTLFKTTSNVCKSHSWSGMGRLLLGYTLYVLPLFGFGTLFMYGQLNGTVCRPIKATFLVDNEITPAHNMSELYQSRQLIGEEKGIEKFLDVFNAKGGLAWDYSRYSGNRDAIFREYQYWPFDNITDLIKQYNFIGYHDVCIYPNSVTDLTITNYQVDQLKNLYYVSHGYAVENNSGKIL